MNSNHIIQYILIALIALLIIFIITKKILKIRKCDSSEDICKCCSSKSICGKAKKSNKYIAQSKK